MKHQARTNEPTIGQTMRAPSTHKPRTVLRDERGAERITGESVALRSDDDYEDWTHAHLIAQLEQDEQEADDMYDDLAPPPARYVVPTPVRPRLKIAA